MGKIISQDNAEHYQWGQGCDGWHLVKTAELSVIQERMPPGASEVKHWHRASRQFFFVLSGTLTLEIGGRREALSPRQGLQVAPGVVHQAINESGAEVEFIIVSQPHSHGDRVVIREDEFKGDGEPRR